MMDEQRFWSLMELAWQAVGGRSEPREKLAQGKLSDEGAAELSEALDEVLPALHDELSALPADELLAFDRILERKLYEIDRTEVQRHTDGSDDGFLYARGFIVAMGKAYFDAVHSKPSVARMDLESEAMCYLSWHLYEEKFGVAPASGISRETGSNKAGW